MIGQRALGLAPHGTCQKLGDPPPVPPGGSCRVYPPVKRFADVVLAAAGLLVGVPLLAVIGVLVRLRLGRPVLYRQARPGLGGRPFVLYKVRTMLPVEDSAGRPLSDLERLTPLGRFLRGTSLDELPELWNVVRGDMSLIGPRPLLMEYLDRYSPEQARRHDVRPGITGLAQVSGRNALDWESRFALDVRYVDNLSLRLDLRILVFTLVRVLRDNGVLAADGSLMQLFAGSGQAAVEELPPTGTTAGRRLP